MNPIQIICILILFLPYNVLSQFAFKYDLSIEVQVNGKPLLNPWAGGLNAGQYNSIDLNLDGVADLAVFDRTSNKLNTFLNINGTYGYAPEYELLFPEDLDAWVVFADYNCDGKKDIFTNTPFGIKLYEQVNNEEGRLAWQLRADPINTEGFTGQINLQVNSSDIPGISDMDNDGDLDILVFNFASGGTIEYHQNLSIENSGNCEKLDFKRITRRWGEFEECRCGIYAFGEESCSNIGGRGNTVNRSENTLHAGGKSILVFDNDGDGDKELIFGDELCNNLVYLQNHGSQNNALFMDFNSNFPNQENPASFFIFPAAYFEDVNADGLNDLIVAPNVFNNIINKMDFIHSNWFYKNIGSGNAPEFELVQKDFLQDEMIETGENAVPAFADMDGDGDFDLLIANKGRLLDDEFNATIQFFENAGTKQSPSFILLNEDYLNLSTLKLIDLKISTGDLNGDGATDLAFYAVTLDGNTPKFYYLLNTNENNGFTFQANNLKGFPLPIDFGDNPRLHDINKDGKADLLVGKASGRLEYYSNEPNGNEMNFRLENSNLSGFEDEFLNRGLVPAVADLNNDGQDELIVIKNDGKLLVIEDFLNKDRTPEDAASDVLKSDLLNGLASPRLGRQAWPVFADLFGNGPPDIVVGGRQGGVSILKNVGNNGEGSGPGSESFKLDIFPNPGSETVRIRPDREVSIQIYNILGSKVLMERVIKANNVYPLDARVFPNGIYMIRARTNEGAIVTKRLIIQK